MPGGTELAGLADRLHLNIVWIGDAGHGINHEKAEEVDHLIIDHLANGEDKAAGSVPE